MLCHYWYFKDVRFNLKHVFVGSNVVLDVSFQNQEGLKY